MNKILVTGGTGFIGSHLVELLVTKGYEIKVFDRYNPNNDWGWLENSKYKNDTTPIDENTDFKNLNLYSKSYLNHLINSNEILASMILTLHNLKFYWELMSAIRNSIKNGQFDQFFNKYIDLL